VRRFRTQRRNNKKRRKNGKEYNDVSSKKKGIGGRGSALIRKSRAKNWDPAERICREIHQAGGVH